MRLPSISRMLRRYVYNLKRSSAIQQGVLNLSTFLISLFLLSITTYFFVTEALSSRVDRTLEQRMSRLMEELGGDDWKVGWGNEYPNTPSLYQQLDQSIQGNDFFLVLSQGDLKLDKNKDFRKAGFSTKELKRNGSGHETQYRILVWDRGDVVFIVAINNENDQEILQIVMSAFLLNGLVALILTALLVIYLANRSHKQIRLIEHVLDKAADGELNQRVGPSPKNNDLAHVSSHIDTMLARLETSLAAMTDISANIAHELKTPISRLRHDLDSALDQYEQGHDVEAALNNAYAESGLITETFDALLRIAQIEGGARRANFTELNLQTVIDAVMDIYCEVAEDSGMTLVKDGSLSKAAKSALLVQGDRELMVQMLANLIENSIRYCPERTTISIGCTVKKAIVTLVVADNGQGIPEADRERVFQRLYRVDKSRSDQGGTGLGLSLVKAIIELHNARIGLEDNQPGLRVVMQFQRFVPLN